jgi:flavin reductase (DIM6/NTAB) family NADH-FMN oxidoreductase RutF
VFHVKHKGGVRILCDCLCGFECKVRHARRVKLAGVGVGGVARRALYDRSAEEFTFESAQ